MLCMNFNNIKNNNFKVKIMKENTFFLIYLISFLFFKLYLLIHIIFSYNVLIKLFFTAACRIYTFILQLQFVVSTTLIHSNIERLEQFIKEANKFPFISCKNIFEFKFVVNHVVLETCF